MKTTMLALMLSVPCSTLAMAAEMPHTPATNRCLEHPIELKEHQACQTVKMADLEDRMAQAYKSLVWSTPSPRKEALVASQAAWVTARDTECAQEHRTDQGFVPAAFLVDGCKIKRTTERVEWLQAALILTWTPRGEDKTVSK